MIIRKMTATFGGLERAVLVPAPGLTVITAPNGGGKSTWAGFLRAMLYGINTRERDKEGYLAEKNRYAPWSQLPMEGEIQLCWRGEEITLRRFGKKNNPFGGFEAVYTASGDPVPGLTGDNAGERLIGVGREMYERTAFVGQGRAAVAGSAELEKRIAALATAGEEEVSFTQTQRTLKDWLNRRRANRANGLLPELDKAILEVKEAISTLEGARQDQEKAQKRVQELETEFRQLEKEQELWARIHRQELDKRYVRAREDWRKALAAVPREAPHPIFGVMSGEEAWSMAQEKVQEKEEAQAEEERRSKERVKLERERSRWSKYAAICAVGGVYSLFLAVFHLIQGRWLPAATLGGLGMVLIVLCLLAFRRGRTAMARWGSLRPLCIPEPGDILEQAAIYRETLAKTKQAKAVVVTAQRLVDELAAQGGREVDSLELLQPPERSREAGAERLRAVEEELSRARRTWNMAQGRMNTLGNIDDYYAKLDWLVDQRVERQREYDALTVAMEALSAANDYLRQRFSPALNQRAGELFARLTGGRYADLRLTRSFDATTTPVGEMLPRSSLSLSQGTVAQLYLAVRLAICQLTVEEGEPFPLVLDETLVDFDDERMDLALTLLKEMGNQWQILLFTCHQREAYWAREHGVCVFPLH